ncbi:MAG TPA: phage tail protein [Jatrophihabitans sp.]|nr:phage tail protein [Jatrophihabitans sp.]
MTLSLRDILGLNNRFHVQIDGLDLGAWGKCHGLEVTFDGKPITQGGIYDHETYLPGQLKYSAITLERAINPKDSMAVQGWLAQVVQKWIYSANGADSGGTAVITLYGSEGTPVMAWTLRNVYPSKWSGPTLDAMTAGIAMEQLAIVHQGFL